MADFSFNFYLGIGPVLQWIFRIMPDEMFEKLSQIGQSFRWAKVINTVGTPNKDQLILRKWVF